MRGFALPTERLRAFARRRRREGRLGLLLVAGALAACASSRTADGATPPATPPPDAHAPLPAVGATAKPVTPPSDSVRITLTILPATATAKVLWGKKLLGVVPPRKPLVIQRPRDSGPLDIVVRADGFLPVQTRIYTFADSKLGVKLTTPEDKKTLLGYREPPPPEVPTAPAVLGASPTAPGAPANEPAPAGDGGTPP